MGAYTATDLARMYNVLRKTFLKWVKPLEEAIGERIGRYYTIMQVKVIIEKLISREIFLKVNDLQDKNAYWYTTTEENDNIPLKRYLRCEKCGSFLRGYIVHVRQLHYYMCNTKSCECNRSAEWLHQHYLEILNEFTLHTESLVPLIRKQMLVTYNRLTE